MIKVVTSHCAMIVVTKKRCKECNIVKTDFYKYKNNKMYRTCIECFNKKVKCEFIKIRNSIEHIHQNITRLFSWIKMMKIIL